MQQAVQEFPGCLKSIRLLKRRHPYTQYKRRSAEIE